MQKYKQYKMKKITFIILFMALIFTQTDRLMAQEKPQKKKKPKLTFGADTRFRYEFQNNFNQKFYGDDPAKGRANDGFLLGRFRVGFDYYPTDKIHIALWGQHGDSWDMEIRDSAFYKGNFRTEHNPNKDRWDLYTTYIEIKEMFDIPLSLKAGRQLIIYGDKRVFGPGEWSNVCGWLWDAAKLSYRFNRGFVDVFYGQTVIHDSRFSLKHRHGFASAGMYAHYEFPENPLNLIVEPMFFTKYDKHNNYYGEKMGYERNPDGSRVTFKKKGDMDSYYAGMRIYGKNIKNFDYDFTYLYRGGDFSHDDIRAYGYHILLAYNFQLDWKPRLSMEYSYASGDSNPSDNDHETFQRPFGAKWPVYGRMNLFEWSNLRDMQVNLELKPAKWFSITLIFHKFMLAERKDAWYLNAMAYRDKTGKSGDDVGREFDIIAVFKLPHGNKIMAGFGHFWPDEFAKKTASHKQANWLLMMWEYKFKIPLL